MNAPFIYVVGCLLAAAVATQDPLAPKETQQEKETPPSLDELLGLDGDEDNAAEQAARQNQEELERRLSDVELGDVAPNAFGVVSQPAAPQDLERRSDGARDVGERDSDGLRAHIQAQQTLAGTQDSWQFGGVADGHAG